MKKLGLFISLCLYFTVMPASALAALTPAVEVTLENSSDPLIRVDNNIGIGTESPSTSCDLSANNYNIQFVYDSAFYSGVNFSNHGSDIYLDITYSSTDSTDDQPFIVELIEKGGSTPATSALIDSNGTWSVRFYNLDTSKEYYLKFIKNLDTSEESYKKFLSYPDSHVILVVYNG